MDNSDLVQDWWRSRPGSSDGEEHLTHSDQVLCEGFRYRGRSLGKSGLGDLSAGWPFNSPLGYLDETENQKGSTRSFFYNNYSKRSF